MPQKPIALVLVVPVLVLVANGLFSPGCEENTTDEADFGTHPGPTNIIGGIETNGDGQWQGVLGIGVFGVHCSATLIHPRIVITAGHCVNFGAGMDLSDNPSMLKIYAGADLTQTQGSQIGTAKQIVSHPTWEGDIQKGGVDMALILLEEEVTDIPYYDLRDFPMPKQGETGLLVGYGLNGDEGGGIQRKGDTTLMDVKPNLIQVGGQSTTCPGDSGGPLFTKQNDQWVLTAVHSFGLVGVCEPDMGMYSVNTLADCHWLNSTYNDMTGEDLDLEKCTLCNVTPPLNWGRGCGPNMPPCTPGTTCITPEDFSKGDYGYCGAPCCNLGNAETELCYDVAAGEESCAIQGEDGTKSCIIHCEEDVDCPKYTICKQRPFESEKICIATPDHGDLNYDTDTSLDTEFEIIQQDSDTIIDAGDEERKDAGTGAGTSPSESSSNDCGCRHAGSSTGTISRLTLFLFTIFN